MLITLRQLQYVISVSENGSFSKAAESCCVEQSTVSQQVKTFEENLGVVIFERNSIPIKTTTAGKEIVLQGKDILNKVETLILPFKKKS